MPKPRRAVDTLGLWFVKSFRGLFCEVKNGGWELSKGSAMSWILFGLILRMAWSGDVGPDLLLYMFGGLMGYNAFKLVDLKGVVGKR